ncbi:MAG: ABC transporter ATP-binding protein [Pseudomonadota bacterium]|nr:ABC transporter ATP-binding protein [Pseudomonadota bacterium]MDE3038650.1 ABC transporter ATP-binding protein [Pseudomonadota bacterium]
MVPPVLVQGVNKSYGGRSVLTAIDLSLAPGEIFGLIGLNGAGKTTLLKIILDLIRADSGQAQIFGIKADDLESRRHLSYLPEKFQPSRYLKGMEYLSLVLSYYGLSLDLDRTLDLARALDLDPAVLSLRVGSYSKGMGQKLGLLGAFLTDAQLLLLDEPMSGLDPGARIKLKALLLAARRQGKTVFFSSHILSDLDEICDRIGVIHDGGLFFTGAPSSFKTQFAEKSLEKAFLCSIGGQYS